MGTWENLAEDGIKQIFVEGVIMPFKDLKAAVMEILKEKLNGSEKEFKDATDEVILAVMRIMGISGMKPRRPTKSS